MKKVTPQQLATQLQTTKTTVIDVRAAEKFTKDHLEHPNATVKNVPKTVIFTGENSEKALEVPFTKQDEVVLTCTTGNSATRCAHMLAEKGYNVRVLDGGMNAWNTSNQ